LGLYREARYTTAGDRAVVAEFGDEIGLEVNHRVRAMAQEIEGGRLEGVTETLPSYNVLYVFYDPLKVSYSQVLEGLRGVEGRLEHVVLPPPRVFVIPTLYGGEMGPDLEDVASHAGLGVEEVVSIHSSVDYHVYFTGFTPGFLFLGGMSPRIATPRLENPRTKVPAGSVGIAGNQTGAYPIQSPGGWRLIGRTPVRLYDPARPEPVLIRAGDKVRFRPISDSEYREISQRVESGEYVMETLGEGGEVPCQG